MSGVLLRPNLVRERVPERVGPHDVRQQHVDPRYLAGVLPVPVADVVQLPDVLCSKRLDQRDTAPPFAVCVEPVAPVQPPAVWDLRVLVVNRDDQSVVGVPDGQAARRERVSPVPASVGYQLTHDGCHIVHQDVTHGAPNPFQLEAPEKVSGGLTADVRRVLILEAEADGPEPAGLNRPLNDWQCPDSWPRWGSVDGHGTHATDVLSAWGECHQDSGPGAGPFAPTFYGVPAVSDQEEPQGGHQGCQDVCLDAGPLRGVQGAHSVTQGPCCRVDVVSLSATGALALNHPSDLHVGRLATPPVRRQGVGRLPSPLGELPGVSR